MTRYSQPFGRLPRVQECIAGYEEFIAKNSSAVSQIESGLRSLTYIIPGRFRESEIASESLHSGVQLLSLYHDSLLARAIARLPISQRPHPTPHNRYTRFWTQKSTVYRRIALLLQVIQHTELLWEMAAKRRGERMRWRVVVLLEFVKAFCRLLLLRITNSRPLLSTAMPERDVDPATLEESTTAAAGGVSAVPEAEFWESTASEKTAASDLETSWIMPRTGLSLPSLPDTSDISTYLMSKVLTADDVKPPNALLRRVQGRGELAEVMYILRPVFYAMAMQYWSGDRKSWRPWLLGFSIDFGARQLAKADLQERLTGSMRAQTALEKDELQRRGWAMGWWFMRGAFYENVTKSWISSAASKLRDKPLLGLAGGIIEDYEFLWNEYYFSTATL